MPASCQEMMPTRGRNISGEPETSILEALSAGRELTMRAGQLIATALKEARTHAPGMHIVT